MQAVRELGEKRGEKSGLITVNNFVVGSSRQTAEMIIIIIIITILILMVIEILAERHRA
jgi:competence protein ComGC